MDETAVGIADTSTTYAYDAGNNRTLKEVITAAGIVLSDYDYGNNLNQLTRFTETDTAAGSVRVVDFAYDLDGNRVSRSENGTVTDTYVYDDLNRLIGLEKPQQSLSYVYTYDSRTRRIQRNEAGMVTSEVFSGGLSVQEVAGGSAPLGAVEAEYVRGSGMGGGVGGMLYSIRGDVIAQTGTTGDLTWQASYKAFGTRTQETGATEDRYRANTKYEDPTGLLNEGFRYRDLETGTFLTRDPLGFVDGPNMYAYVVQNPWSAFDPEGLLANFAIGAAIGGGLELGMQLYSNGGNWDKVDWGKVGMSAAIGAVSGGVGGFIEGRLLTGAVSIGGRMAAMAVGGAASGAVEQVMFNAVNSRPLNENLGQGMLIGGLAGAASEPAGKMLGYVWRKSGGSKAIQAILGKADSAGGASQLHKSIRDQKPCGCFTGETLVTTENGLTPIKDIQVGDMVLSRNVNTGEDSYQPVMEVFRQLFSTLHTIELPGEVIEATHEHPFWVVSGEDLKNRPVAKSSQYDQESVSGRWVEADDLRIGDVLLRSNGNQLKIINLRIQGRSDSQVFNLAVQENSNYFVGANVILVHNTNGNGCNIASPTPQQVSVTLRQQRELAIMTSQTRNELVGNFDALRSELSPSEIDAIADEPWRMVLFFGTALEGRVARKIQKHVAANPDSVLKDLVWTGRSNKPQDFIGPGNFGFDITGGSMSSILQHQARKGVDSVVTYDSIPSNLGFQFVKWLEDGN